MGTTDPTQAQADRRADEQRRAMREELRAEFPDITDEQIAAQWALVVALGLDV